MKGRRGVSPSASRPIIAGEPLLLLVVVVVWCNYHSRAVDATDVWGKCKTCGRTGEGEQTWTESRELFQNAFRRQLRENKAEYPHTEHNNESKTSKFHCSSGRYKTQGKNVGEWRMDGWMGGWVGCLLFFFLLFLPGSGSRAGRETKKKTNNNKIRVWKHKPTSKHWLFGWSRSVGNKSDWSPTRPQCRLLSAFPFFSFFFVFFSPIFSLFFFFCSRTGTCYAFLPPSTSYPVVA